MTVPDAKELLFSEPRAGGKSERIRKLMKALGSRDTMFVVCAPGSCGVVCEWATEAGLLFSVHQDEHGPAVVEVTRP